MSSTPSRVTSPETAELEFRVLSRDCVSRPVFEHLTGRWGALVILALHENAQRFSEIRRQIDGINEKALSQSLRSLERDGFVERHASDGFPMRVEYNLTALGKSTADLLHRLVDHLEGSMLEVLAAQATYDERQPPRS